MVFSKKRILAVGILLLVIVKIYAYTHMDLSTMFIPKEIDHELNHLLNDRNKAILKEDEMALQSFYDQDIKYGRWAYEHEVKKMKYLHKWSKKQGVRFIDIVPDVDIRWIKEKGDGFVANLVVSTEYKYEYEEEEETENVNSFRIGTYHSIYLKETDEGIKITREWYTDPFADSLHMEDVKTEKIKEYILAQKKRDFSNLGERIKEAVKYADEYCGAAGIDNRKYNKKYRNYNPLGGDCANFASQILYEGGKFRKNSTWNYGRGATKAWVNAHGFKDYMIYSGRASVIAHGTYESIYKASYKLKPGDFVAYEKKGKVTHISVVTGADSKGYSLVNCHNTDRYRVPWDLGWSNKGIKYWLVHVHF
ncbi:amidase domain-containing protein [Lutibacter sp. B2]|nr:amidase domain-containing protein [Lutibacter sp. B2]